jgi:hypothetical protein
MALTSVACAYDDHGGCPHDKVCECGCHAEQVPEGCTCRYTFEKNLTERWGRAVRTNTEPSCPVHAGEAKLTQTPILLTQARERAHAAVKAFDHRPDLTRVVAAIEALSQYEQHLKEASDGR